MVAVALPLSLRQAHGHGGPLAAWVAGLPEVLARVRDEWRLETGPPFEPGGQTAWVAPARASDGAAVVLKLRWCHDEATHEADALRAWNGDGAVRLLRARSIGTTDAMLLERAIPGVPLSTRPEAQLDDVVAGRLQRLWIAPPPGHPFRPLSEMCERWAAAREDRAAQPGRADDGPAGLDDGLVRTGIELFRSLPREPTAQVLLATDLHAGNVLAAQRDPWLVIDPKPYVGDPTYDALQHLLNCPTRLHADPDALVARTAARLDLDGDRLRLWLFARCVVEDRWRPSLDDVAARLRPR